MVASKKVSDFVHLLLTLEPRMMFDAAATTTGAETLSQQSVQQSSPSVAVESSSSMEKGEAHLAPASGQSVPLDERTGRQSQTSSEATRYTQVGFPSRKEILFIDSSVKDAETLLSGLDPSIEIYRLDQTIDGISQIADILQHRTGLDAIHLIAHGAEAEIQFGTTKLTSESIMGEFRQQLATIGQSMNSEGDLLIYGCDFGRGDAGQAAMGLLADITGADVQASNNATGATQLGGDWILELSSGPIETLSVVRSASSTQWDGLLAPPQIDLDGNDSSGMTGGNYTTEYPVAGGSLKVTGIDAKLTDPTSATLSSLTVTISNQLNGNSETLSANTTGTSIASSFNSGTGTLTLSGVDTVENYQSVLRTITYQNSAAFPDRTDRAITFFASDGTLTSPTVTTTLTYWNNVLDRFDSNTYTGNNGSVNWTGNWQEINDNNNSASGLVFASGTVLNRVLPIDIVGLEPARGVERQVDLSLAKHAVLSLDYRIGQLAVLGGVLINVQVSSDGGTNWNTVLTTVNGTLLLTDTASHSASVDISSYISATTRIRLSVDSIGIVNVAGNVYFDNIEVRYDGHTNSPSLDLDADNSSGATGNISCSP